MSSKGFSLIETMISIGIFSFLVLLAVSLHIYDYSSYLSFRRLGDTRQSSLVLIDYLTKQFQNAGGGSVSGWMAIWIENQDNCPARWGLAASTGADRMTTMSLSQPSQAFGIQTDLGSGTLKMSFIGVCGLTAALINHPAMLTSGNSHAQVVITAVDAATCNLTYVPGQASPGDYLTVGFVDWAGGTASLVDVKTLYVDQVKNELHTFTDSNNNGTVDPGEDQLLADQVYDMQIALGYDFNPADGVINVGGATNEWLYNAPGQTLGAGGFGLALPSNLRMVQFGVTMGSNLGANVKSSNTVSILDGNALNFPGIALEAVSSQIALRNIFLFQ